MFYIRLDRFSVLAVEVRLAAHNKEEQQFRYPQIATPLYTFCVPILPLYDFDLKLYAENTHACQDSVCNFLLPSNLIFGPCSYRVGCIYYHHLCTKLYYVL